MRGLSKCAIVLDGSPKYKRKYTEEANRTDGTMSDGGNRELSAKAKSMNKEKI